MIENNAVKKMVKSILRNKQNTFSDRNIMHPEREWFLGVSVGIIFLVIAISWSMKTYTHFNNLSAIDLEEQEKGAIYKASLVEAALTDFSDRKKMYENLKERLINDTKKVEAIVSEELILEPVDISTSTDLQNSETNSVEKRSDTEIVF